MSKAIIEKVDDKEQAVIKVDFNVGEVYRESVSEDGNSRTIVSGMGIVTMKQFYKEIAMQKAKEGDYEGFTEMLEEYTKMHMLDVIGVQVYPLQIVDGQVKGLKEEVEVEFK